MSCALPEFDKPPLTEVALSLRSELYNPTYSDIDLGVAEELVMNGKFVMKKNNQPKPVTDRFRLG